MSQVLPIQMVLAHSAKLPSCYQSTVGQWSPPTPSVVLKYHQSSQLAEKHLKNKCPVSITTCLVLILIVWAEAKECELVKAPLGD